MTLSNLTRKRVVGTARIVRMRMKAKRFLRAENIINIKVITAITIIKVIWMGG